MNLMAYTAELARIELQKLETEYPWEFAPWVPEVPEVEQPAKTEDGAMSNQALTTNELNDAEVAKAIAKNSPAYDIHFEPVPVYHPKGPFWIAMDRLTYDADPESSWNIHGYGNTKAEAVADLLEQLEDVMP